MTVNTSRIVEFPFEVPKMLVNNPDLVRVIPLSPKSIQLSAVKQGITQLNIWSMDDKVTSIDLVITGDVQELDAILKTEFPDAALKLRTLNSSLYISGFVPKADNVGQITQVARDYFPNIINNMSVGGVQKVLLHVKVLEVSRTKLRNLGFDWAQISSTGFVTQGVSKLIPATGGVLAQPVPLGGSTIRFGITDGSEQFYGFLEALKQNNLAKLMAEPTLVTVSGRAASFNSGGEIPIPIPQSLGVTTIEYREFGTQIDFVPIVLGNGNVRLEVRAQVTEVDGSLSAAVGAGTVPGFRVRRADTGAEMKTGQTLAIAGLVYSKLESSTRGIPWLMDVPWAGAAFRRNSEQMNEVELVIMVTPEFAEAMDPTEVPACGPGQFTTSPTDVELFYRGYLEVPKACENGNCAPGMQGHGPVGGGGYEELPSPAPITNGQSARKNIQAVPTTYPSLRTAGTPTPAKTPRSASSQTSSRQPQSRSNPSSRTQEPRKPSAGAKPTLIGPLGYDELK